jgi:hypothetical protein
VQVQVELNLEARKLATFTFLVVVEPGVALGGKSEDYVNWAKAFLPQSTGAKVGQYLQIAKVDDAGRVIEVASENAPADDALQAALSAREIAEMSDGKAEEAIRICNEVTKEMEAYSPSGTRSIAEAAMRMASQRLVAPTAAEVGQFVRIKEIDSNGAVTAVETVAGTSAVELPLLADVTSEESLTIFDATLSKRATRRAVMQITIPTSEAVGAVCYGRLNGKLWDGYIFGNSALPANGSKWLELEFLEGGLVKYTVSNSAGGLWGTGTVNTCGKLLNCGYVDSIGIHVNDGKTAPAGTRIQVWGE